MEKNKKKIAVEYSLEKFNDPPRLALSLYPDHDGVILAGRDQAGKNWHIARLTEEGQIYLYMDISRATGLDVDELGRIRQVK